MLKSLRSGAFLLLAFLVMDTLPSRKAGVQGEEDNQGSPELSEEARTDITNLANSINDDTFTSNLNSAVDADDRIKATSLLIQAAAGDFGGSQADWDQAQAIAIAVNDPLTIIGILIGDGTKAEPKIGSKNGSISLLPKSFGLAGDQPPTLGTMIPVRVAMAKLRIYTGSSTATQEQKDIRANLEAAYYEWQAQAKNATTAVYHSWSTSHLGNFNTFLLNKTPRPSNHLLMQMFENNAGFAEAVRKAADDLKNSDPSFTALYDAIPQSRAIARDQLAKLLDMYQGNLTATGIAELVTAATEVTEFGQKVLEEDGASTALVNDMAKFLTDVQQVISNNMKTNLYFGDTDKLPAEEQVDMPNQQEKMLQKLGRWTGRMLLVTRAFAPSADRLKAALTG